MPFLQVFTSVSRARIPENFGPQLAKVLSSAMRNKPPEQIAVQVSPDCYFSLGDVENLPFAMVSLRSIGSMDVDDNRKSVKVVTEFINSKLGVEPINIRMVMQNHSTDTVAANGLLICDM